MSQKPPGLFYYKNVISEQLSGQLLDYLENDCELFPVANKDGFTSENARLVAHFGFTYNYVNGSTNKKAPKFPDIIHELADLISTAHTFPQNIKFNQCIINRYLPGQGIGAHYDRKDYGEYIACFTIGSGAEMEFTKRMSKEKETFSLYTEPNSLYIMSGASRYDWLHQMRPRRKDPGHPPRGTRWSLTFRTVTINEKKY